MRYSLKSKFVLDFGELFSGDSGNSKTWVGGTLAACNSCASVVKGYWNFSLQCAFTSVFVNNVLFLHVLNYKSHNQFILYNPVLLSDILFSHIILERSTYISPRNIQALEIILARKHSISKSCPLRYRYSTFNMLKLVYIRI